MEVTRFETDGVNVADQMKTIRKIRLQRQVLEHPEMAGELVRLQATGTYNAKGNIVQSVGNLGAA